MNTFYLQPTFEKIPLNTIFFTNIQIILTKKEINTFC
jgi:hypothetical protein